MKGSTGCAHWTCADRLPVVGLVGTHVDPVDVAPLLVFAEGSHLRPCFVRHGPDGGWRQDEVNGCSLFAGQPALTEGAAATNVGASLLAQPPALRKNELRCHYLSNLGRRQQGQGWLNAVGTGKGKTALAREPTCNG